MHQSVTRKSMSYSTGVGSELIKVSVLGGICLHAEEAVSTDRRGHKQALTLGTVWPSPADCNVYRRALSPKKLVHVVVQHVDVWKRW